MFFKKKKKEEDLEDRRYRCMRAYCGGKPYAYMNGGNTVGTIYLCKKHYNQLREAKSIWMVL